MIAITGATGFVGQEVVRQARAGGHAARAIVRDPKRAQWLADKYGVELFHGNVLFAPSLDGAMQGVKCVIHLLGIINEWRENTFQRVHAEATMNVADEAKKGGVKRFLHMSALGTRPDARSRYHQTKWAAEECVRKSGLAWTVFRPSVIYGPQDKSINVLAKVIRLLPFVPVLGDGNSKIQPISVQNVAKCFVAAIKSDETIGKTYDLCGPEAFTWNELYDKLMKLYCIRKLKVHLPLPIARLQAAVFEKLLANPPFTRDQLIMTEEDNVGDPKPAERDFLLEQESFEAGIARYLQRPA
ncbi:MAG: complex I NDUFA9 subunit family protein [Verrucomicrobiia bacterium]|jgi:NADH dehydrogenase